MQDSDQTDIRNNKLVKRGVYIIETSAWKIRQKLPVYALNEMFYNISFVQKFLENHGVQSNSLLMGSLQIQAI